MGDNLSTRRYNSSITLTVLLVTENVQKYDYDHTAGGQQKYQPKQLH